MDDELREYVRAVRVHRAQMAESVAAVDAALDHPLGVAKWRERVLAAVAELAHDFRHHRVLTEADGGWYERIRREAPHVSGQIDRLCAEHVEISDVIRGVLERLEAAPGELTSDELAELREDITALGGRLVRHRQKGSDLVYAAYEFDIGGSG